MTLFSRYVFRQVSNAFIVILLTLTAVVWLATALKQLDLITSQGQGVWMFLKMNFLTLPNLMALIAPNAMLMASLYTLDRMNGDSELIVMTASGAPIWRIAAPFVLLSSAVCIGILISNLWIMPATLGVLRDYITQVRTDLISQVLQPGRFSSPDTGMTFHIRDRDENGDLLGLLIHDERDPKQVMTYLADRGRIVTNDKGSYLVMFHGDVQRSNSQAAEKGADIIAFDQYMLDLSAMSKDDDDDDDDDDPKGVHPREMYVSELLHPNFPAATLAHYKGQLRSELHDRFATPFYPLLFTLIGVALLGHARTTRESRWGQILSAAGIGVGLRLFGIAAGNLLTLHSWAVVLVYAIPVIGILVAVWAAQVRMDPELRSKLSLELNSLRPRIIIAWAVRGMRAQ